MSANSPAMGLPWYRTERLHGTTWLMWRQNRWLVWVLTVAVVALGAYLSYSAHFLRAAGDPAQRGGGCAPGPGLNITSAACSRYIDAEIAHTNLYVSDIRLAILALPVLIGMFVGAPLLTREYEHRTQLLAWTQSVAPVRWLAARLGLTAAVVGLGTAALSALSYWFWQDYVASSGVVTALPFARGTYPSLGAMPLVYSLYALALGLAVGLLLRSLLMSILVTGLLVGLTEIAMSLLRQYLYPAVSVVRAASAGGLDIPANAWALSSGVILGNGSRVPFGTGCDATKCADVTGYYGSYQPASHLWPMQGVESAIVLAMAAVLTLVVFRLLRSRRS